MILGPLAKKFPETAMDIEDTMRELIDYNGYYTEHEYNTHMKNLKDEIQNWAKFIEDT